MSGDGAGGIREILIFGKDTNIYYIFGKDVTKDKKGKFKYSFSLSR